MEKNINDYYPNEKNWDYYDGIPPEVAEIHAKMTLDELEAEIEAEKARCNANTKHRSKY